MFETQSMGLNQWGTDRTCLLTLRCQVRVSPQPLSKPFLVAISEDLTAELGLSPEEARSGSFLRFVSGDLSAMPEATAWATPYAVSVRGMPIPSPCQFNGKGYGDGRAATVGQFRGNETRWELQLKVSTTRLCLVALTLLNARGLGPPHSREALMGGRCCGLRSESS